MTKLFYFYPEKFLRIRLVGSTPTSLNTFNMACFVQVRAKRNGAKTSEQVSYEIKSKRKLSSISVWAEIATFLSQEIKFSCFFYILDTKNREMLAYHEMFGEYSEAQYHQRIVLIHTSDIVTKIV